MDQHPHTWYGYLNHHFAFISLVCVPTFLFYLRCFVDACQVAGYTKLAERLGKFQLFLTTFVSDVKNRNQNTQPTVRP